MKEVIKCLESIKSDIEAIERLRVEHELMLNAISIEKSYTNARIKAMRETNNKVRKMLILK